MLLQQGRDGDSIAMSGSDGKGFGNMTDNKIPLAILQL